MRLLNTGDLFAAARFLKLVNAREIFRGFAEEAPELPEGTPDDEREEALERFVFDKGYNTLWSLIESASDRKAELSLYEFLSRPYEMTPQEVEAMPLAEQIDSIKKLAQDNDLATFFGQALGLRR